MYVFAVGGTSQQQGALPDNYLLTPKMEMDENNQNVLFFDHKVIPKLNYAREGCASFIINNFLFVVFGR